MGRKSTKNNKITALQHLAVSREKKLEVLDKSFLILREDDLPQLLRPIKLRTSARCALTNHEILPGDYAYPCHVNPFRISVYGPHKVSIESVINNRSQDINKHLSSDSIGVRIPTTESVYSKSDVLRVEQHRRKLLEQRASTLLLRHK